MKIIVLNLPRTTTKDALAELFKPYGQITSADLVMDKIKGTSKGFGFVEMNDKVEAERAIKALHGKQIGVNKIRVKLADEH
jgi:RNA recognition motif-containing protein